MNTKRILLTAFGCLVLLPGALWGQVGIAPIVVQPEQTTYVEMSNTEVNRISCSDVISDIAKPPGRHIEPNYVGKNAFITFPIMKQGDTITYASDSARLFISCGGSVYDIIAVPKKSKETSPIYLAPPKGNALKENIARLGGLDHEERCLKILNEIRTGKTPETYILRTTERTVKLSPDLRIIQTRQWDIEGVGIRVNEFDVTALPGRSERLALTEKYFYKKGIGKKVVAISLERLNLDPGQSTRMFVLEYKEGGQ